MRLLHMITLGYLLLSVLSFAQEYTPDSYPITATLFVNQHPAQEDQFTDKWNKGNLTYSNGIVVSECDIRYNRWIDELIYLRRSDYKMGCIIKDNITSFIIHTPQRDKHYIAYNMLNAFFEERIYLEVLYEGAFSLYCHRKVEYIKSSKVFVERNEYYIKQEQTISKFNFRKKNILELIPESDHKTFKKLMNQHHLKLKNEYDVARAISLLFQ